jgi:hypothetical protein
VYLLKDGELVLGGSVLASILLDQLTNVMARGNRMKRLIALGAMALLAKSAFATIITDPVGDASGHADVVALSGVYNQTTLFLSAQFQPGTLDPTSLAFFIGLDTDQNPATGEQPFFPIGSEFVVGFNSLASTSQATIFQQHVGLVGSVPISFGTNSFTVAVPLSMLGNDDGAALFGLAEGVPTDPSSFDAFDYVPDSARGGGPLGGPTSVLSLNDSGATTLLFALGIAALGLVKVTTRKREADSS